MSLTLVGVGGLGLMLSPSAKHLKPGGPAVYKRIHDRGAEDPRRDACRRAWREHGAELVSDYESLVGDGDFDGVVICAGKNGDDLEIIRALTPLLPQRPENPCFILHLSTVSAGFAQAAHDFLAGRGVQYANYPLTGGPLGAETAKMLILASGDAALYERLEPMLEAIGSPKYFGEGATLGAEVKLIGQLMVFNGLLGISSAAALKAECFGESLVGADQAAFFDFLNNGAGGTRQWDVALSKGVRDDVWDQGFMIHHAVVDAIYAAQLGREKGLPAAAVFSILAVAVAFAFVLKKSGGAPQATHAVAREFLAENAAELDAFAADVLTFPDVPAGLDRCIAALPEKVQRTIALDVDEASFG
jgi:3-hydroxyisobutyrate dehydrogenase